MSTAVSSKSIQASQIRISYQKAAEVFRAQHGDYEARKHISMGLASMLYPARTFAEFLEVNRDYLDLYEEYEGRE